ncbi:MAG: UDP-N-acetylmuramate--L-alanine ligase, partial [Elusimicrobia bacterium]|nr:UDP-N-acetylmuramate--L-alanine ligase [Elusimicrobiota bacterium]
ISTAVQASNPEVRFAQKKKIPVIPRIEMLAELARLKYTIAVAGTHGKTTTTSMIASLLQGAGLDPTFVVGGKLNHLQSGAQLGHGEFLVAEADESDGSFLKLSPTLAVITNIDDDHLDFYGTMRNLKKSFIEFGNSVPFYGCTIVCAEDEGVQSILPELKRRVVTYGFSPEQDYSALRISFNGGTQYTLRSHGAEMGRIRMDVAGNHNLLNSLAACACGIELGIPFEKIAPSLEKFHSVARRLEIKGQRKGTTWVDDYGHHPTEIKATISALRQKFPGKKVIVLFQPHRYSRTQILLKEFGKSFPDADKVFLMPIYPAGEKPIAGVSSKHLAAVLKKNGVNTVLMNGSQGSSFWEEQLGPDTVFLTLGAGDVWKAGQQIFAPVD